MKSFALFAAAALALATPAFAAENYTLDPNHTNITWQANHFGFSNPDGKFASATGTLVLDRENPVNSKVEVTIATNGLVTGLPTFDEHIKSDKFLNVAQFPTATFVSDKVELTGKDTARVTGNLTLLGVTKPVVLEVKLNQIGINPINSKQTAGFSATTTIKRSDWGMTTYVPNISDEVKISIEAEANLAG